MRGSEKGFLEGVLVAPGLVQRKQEANAGTAETSPETEVSFHRAVSKST